MVWLFCPKYRNDGQHEFGVNWHEYVAWKNKPEIEQREIPYKRLGTHNYFFAGDSASDEADEHERFRSEDFVINGPQGWHGEAGRARHC